MKLLTFCKNSIKRLKDIQKIEKNRNFLIGVKGGGCNGLKYYIHPTDKEGEKNDEKLQIEGINIIMCNKSLFYLIGTHVEWNEDIMGNRFNFVNPNSTGTCGCGETFSI
tara:strand:+ start:255 stop:581 length:327 start_codon:yes stop_codon:yes gene_type:complete